MNIVIFSWRGPGHPHAGGAEKSTHEHAKRWVKAGHGVTLFTSDYLGCKKEEVIDGVKIKRCGSQILKVHLKAFKWYVLGNHPKYDLVVDQFHGIPFFTPLFVKEKKLAFIHEVTKEVWKLNPLIKPLNLLPSLFGTSFEPLIFKILYKNIPFMTVSSSTKNDLIEWGIAEKNITVIQNGLNKPPIKILSAKSKKKTLIYLGALAKDKGVEDALKIFSIVNSKKKGYQFWIVGEGEAKYSKYLKLKSETLGLLGKIKFFGFVSERVKYQLLAKAHILINPSTREGWGLVVMEAASVGTPTIGYDVPGLRDSIVDGETGLLSDKDPESMVKIILPLMEDKEKYEKFRSNGISRCKKFSWEKSAKLSLDLLDKLAKT